MTFHQKITKLSCDFGPSGQSHECGDKSVVWVLRKKDYLVGKVDLASQGLIEIFTEEEVDPRFPQEDMLRGVFHDCT